MFRSIFASLVSFAALVSAQTASDLIKYPEYARFMHHYGYTWESFEITTDDGYILTTFRVTGNKNMEVTPDESLNPVMLMHGLGCDATSWVDPGWEPFGDPLPLRLFNRGFDVYMASNRGTKYCQQHETLALDTPEYWAFSWAEMGLYDDVSNVKFIKERTGKKVSYVGVSQGTVQMFYALAKEQDFFADNLFTFAAIDPCTIDVTEGDWLYTDGLFHFSEYGIYAFGGPNWDEDLNTICENFDQGICDYASGCAGGEPVSLQTNVHWAQNVVEQRFQEYATDYMDGAIHTRLIDLGQITKVPVSIWSGLLDTTCANAQAHITAKEIGERVTYFRTLPWADHGYWGGPAVEGIYKELEERLINPEKKSYPLLTADLLKLSTN